MGFAAVPASTGPLARLAEVAIQGAPAAASAGELVRVSVTVRVRSTGPRMITTPGTSALLVVSSDGVVARQGAPRSTGAVPLILKAGSVAPAQAVPSEVRLSADGGAPLAPGGYSLLAVLGYQTDSLNTRADGALAPPTGARAFVLVSAPVPLEVH